MNRYPLYGALGVVVIVLGIALVGPRHQAWNFTDEDDAQEWDMRGVTVSRDPLGIRVQTQGDAALRLSDLQIPIRDYALIILKIKGDRALAGKLRATVDPPFDGKDTVEMPFEFPPGEIRGAFSLESIPAPQSSLQSLYLLFDEGEDFILSSVLLQHRSLLADLRTILASSWTFDVFSPITINLLVGPHITKDPTHIPFLFPVNNVDLSTPSANVVWYWLIAIGLGFGFGFGIRKGQRGRLALTGLFIAFIGTWILSDIRMGAELFSYAKQDYDTYISQPGETRTVRDRGRLYDFAQFVAETIPRGAPYNFAAPDSWPYLGILRYATVPSTPIYFQNTGDARYPLWVFYDVANIEIRDEGLYVGDTPITSHGSVLGVFDEGSFIFMEEG